MEPKDPSCEWHWICSKFAVESNGKRMGCSLSGNRSPNIHMEENGAFRQSIHVQMETVKNNVQNQLIPHATQI